LQSQVQDQYLELQNELRDLKAEKEILEKLLETSNEKFSSETLNMSRFGMFSFIGVIVLVLA